MGQAKCALAMAARESVLVSAVTTAENLIELAKNLRGAEPQIAQLICEAIDSFEHGAAMALEAGHDSPRCLAAYITLLHWAQQLMDA